MFNLSSLSRFADEAAGEECSEGNRVADVLSQKSEGETKADRSDHGRLFTFHPDDELHEAWNDEEPCDDDTDQKREQLAHAQRNHPDGEPNTGGARRQYG